MSLDNKSFGFHVEAYDFYSSFYDSVVGLELARRAVRHTFYATFGYQPTLPHVLERRELIASELDRLGRVTREVRAWDEGLVELRIERTPQTRRRIEAWGYFHTKEQTAECLAILRESLPPETSKRCDDVVNVNFWHGATIRGEYQPKRQSETMRVPKWDEIDSNYPVSVRRSLAETMRLSEESVAVSRLMLWRGLPGTGKTWAIRALMREWVEWCTFHYVVDTAAFFSSSTYMLSLLSKAGETAQAEEGSRKWSLIILEDAGEFAALDAGHRYGQALARLLNLSDGMLGQGQRLMFLITTNEELQNLHPAIVRHGRCLANLEFPEFSESEARAWLESRGASSVL